VGNVCVFMKERWK